MPRLTVPEVQVIQAYIEPIKSKRARIIVGMVELLKTITVERTYENTVLEVSTDSFPWENKTIGQTPAIYVDDLQSQLITHAGPMREEIFNLLVYGIVREMTLVQFEGLITDVKKCIYDNNSLFGQCNLMRVQNILTDANFHGRIDGTRVFQAHVECLYTWCVNDAQ